MEIWDNDNFLLAKTDQAYHANRRRGPEIVGDKVLLSNSHHRREFMQHGDHRVAKFMVRYDGPYSVDSSIYTLNLPVSMDSLPKCHTFLLCLFIANNNRLFPGRQYGEPDTDGGREWVVNRILDRRCRT